MMDVEVCMWYRESMRNMQEEIVREAKALGDSKSTQPERRCPGTRSLSPNILVVNKCRLRGYVSRSTQLRSHILCSPY